MAWGQGMWWAYLGQVQMQGQWDSRARYFSLSFAPGRLATATMPQLCLLLASAGTVRVVLVLWKPRTTQKDLQGFFPIDSPRKLYGGPFSSYALPNYGPVITTMGQWDLGSPEDRSSVFFFIPLPCHSFRYLQVQDGQESL